MKEEGKSLQEILKAGEEKFTLWIDMNRRAFIEDKQELKRAFHEQIEIKYFLEGKTTVIVEKMVYSIKPGDLLVINPYEFHTTIELEEAPCRYHILMIDLDFFAGRCFKKVDLYNIFIVERTKIVNQIRNDKRLNDIIQNIVYEHVNKLEGYRTVIEGLLVEFFTLLLRDYRNVSGDAGNTIRNESLYKKIEPAVNTMLREFSRNFTIGELAELCSMSKYHFCRLFKQVTNVTPIQYLTEYRLKYAEILMSRTDFTITEVAERCGFGDVAYFSRVYKKHKGVSPKAYKQ